MNPETGAREEVSCRAMKSSALVLSLLAVAACGAEPPAPKIEPPRPPPSASVDAAIAAPLPPPGPTEIERFTALRDRILETALARDPVWGRYLGLHDAYDSKLTDYSKDGFAKAHAQIVSDLAALDGIEASKLAPDDALDLALLKRTFKHELFRGQDLADWRKSPLFYSEIFGVDSYLDKDYAPLETRAKRLLAHEEAALAQVANIRANLELPLSKPVTLVAIKMFTGYATYLRGEVAKRVGAVGDEAFRAHFKETNEKLAVEAQKFVDWLKTKVLPTADDSHILGADRYKKLLEAQEGLTTPIDDLRKMNEENLAANKKAYEELVAKGVKAKRPKPVEYLQVAAQLTEEARKFVADHHVITVPTDDRATVRETPPFARWNPASLSMTGPFESPVVAFFNVTLPDPSLPKKEQEEYVQSSAAIRMIAVHEVWPGHFVHGLKAMRAPTKFQKMQFSYTFTEGWAHYTEQMMLDEGFGADDPQNRLGQLQQALIRNCRFAASIAIHVDKRSLDDVEKRFMTDCYVDKPNAREQTARGTFDPGYFAYTLGKLQILALREEAKKALGEKFSLQKFHDALLAHGAPPVAMIRERVLSDLGAAP